MSNTVNASCPTCKALLEVTVGRKSTARVVTCACGARYDYSCWVVKRSADATFTKVELFPIGEGKGVSA
jgi:hypothetical protein